jgi:simple sugar transport system permease protein
LACCGFPATDVLQVWTQGALGSGVRIALSLEEATPLLLTGLAAAVAFRAGVFNIGAEGQYLLGALALVGVTTRWSFLVDWAWSGVAMAMALGVAAAVGAGWALLASVLERHRAVPIVLSTILLNFVAIAFMGAVIEGPLHDPSTSAPQTPLISDALHLPVLVTGSKLHAGALVAALVALALALIQSRSVLGFEMRVSGLNPLVARHMGMPVGRRQTQVMAFSGALAGLAGGMQVLGVTYFMTSTSASYGYAGVAVALLGRLHPLGVALAALFFGMLDTGTRNLEKHLAIPHDLGDLVRGMIVMAVLVSAAVAMRLGQLRQRTAPGLAAPSVAGHHD